MHDPERFRELLDSFRDSHGEFDVPFSLRVCRLIPTPQMMEGKVVSWDDMLKNWVKALDQPRGDVHLIGEIRFPFADPTMPSWARLSDPICDEQMGRQCGDELMGRRWQSGIVYSQWASPMQRQAAERFTNLAKAAGKVLPLSLRDALPRELSFAQPKKFVDRWLRLMFWTNPPDLQELLKLNQMGSGWAWFGQPFSDAADVIERCRLASSKPTFATEGNRWPCWAGQIPKSVLRAHQRTPDGKKLPTSQRREIESIGDGKSLDKSNGQSDTLKKSKNRPKRRQLNAHGKACIKEFKAYKRRGDPQTMRYVVKEYVADHPDAKESSLTRMLSDHNDQWKP